MKRCKYCNCYISEDEENCPLCGAHAEPAASETSVASGVYPKVNVTKTHKRKTHDILVGVLLLIIAALALTSILTNNIAFVAIAVTSVGFLWLTIFRHIFYSREWATIISLDFFYTILLFNLICLRYYASGSTGILNVSFGIVTPILLAVMNVTLMAAAFISGKWYKYAFHANMLGVAEIIMLIVAICVGISYVASIVCAALGLGTIVFSFVFGKEIVISEFKKRFHI